MRVSPGVPLPDRPGDEIPKATSLNSGHVLSIQRGRADVIESTLFLRTGRAAVGEGCGTGVSDQARRDLTQTKPGSKEETAHTHFE